MTLSSTMQIALESSSSSSGVAFVDMADVIAAIKANQTTLPSSKVAFVEAGAGGMYRFITRGSKYIITPTDRVSGVYTKVCEPIRICHRITFH